MNRMTTSHETTLAVMFAVLATGILSSVAVTNMAYAQTNSDNHPVICGAGPILLGIIGHPWFSAALGMWCGFSASPNNNDNQGDGSGNDNSNANGNGG
jgi:hypothetical protein